APVHRLRARSGARARLGDDGDRACPPVSRSHETARGERFFRRRPLVRVDAVPRRVRTRLPDKPRARLPRWARGFLIRRGAATAAVPGVISLDADLLDPGPLRLDTRLVVLAVSGQRHAADVAGRRSGGLSAG